MSDELEFFVRAPTTNRASSPTFDRAIDHYIELALAEEKKSYSSKVEPFDAHATKYRQKLSDQLHAFKNHFMRGYSLLLAEIEPTEESITPYIMDESKFAAIDSFEKITQFYADGNSLYKLLGYSPDQLTRFYKAAHKITEQSRFQDGYDAYFFLVTIAPHLREAWLNYGYNCCQLGDYPSGIEAFANALQLDPTLADSYLATAGAWLKQQNYDYARQACELGIGYAQKHMDTPWAQELSSLLEEAKQQIDKRR